MQKSNTIYIILPPGTCIMHLLSVHRNLLLHFIGRRKIYWQGKKNSPSVKMGWDKTFLWNGRVGIPTRYILYNKVIILFCLLTREKNFVIVFSIWCSWSKCLSLFEKYIFSWQCSFNLKEIHFVLDLYFTLAVFEGSLELGSHYGGG